MLKIGDIVYLKSGSPKLTVVETHVHEEIDVDLSTLPVAEVSVAWMHYETQTLRTARLPVEAVRGVEEKPIYNRSPRDSEYVDQYVERRY